MTEVVSIHKMMFCSAILSVTTSAATFDDQSLVVFFSLFCFPQNTKVVQAKADTMYTFLAFALTLVAKANAATHHCYHNYQLRGVLNIALPGDDILLFPGRFIGNFDAYNNGLPDNPITIRSQDPNNKAIIDGITYDDQSTIGLYVAANYYKIKNLIVENANKGIVFDNSLGSEVVDCEVRKTGK